MLARNLRYYWRSHLTIGLGVVITTAVIVGSLLVGDIVRSALRGLADDRLGTVDSLIVARGRFFNQSLADDLQAKVSVPVAPVLLLPGSAAPPNWDGEFRPHVRVYGVDDRFGQVAAEPFSMGAEGCYINEALAEFLGMSEGRLNLTMPKPQWLPNDAVLAPDEGRKDLLLGNLPIKGVLGAEQLGGFDLAANQRRAYNVYVPLRLLQEKADYLDQVNMFLFKQGGETAAEIDAVVAEVWEPSDVGLFLHDPGEADGGKTLELRSKRIFIQQDVSGTMTGEQVQARTSRTFTYLVDRLAKPGAEDFTPYSMVTGCDASLFGLYGAGTPLPADWRDDQIVVNDWLAQDLGLAIGDTLELTYKKVDEGNKLVDETTAFTVAAILPMQGAAADPSLMPPFPGITDKQNCKDWDPGHDMDLDTIRPQDEQYWTDHRGTPKAFITIAKAQELWSNHYGNLTSIRVAKADGPQLIADLRKLMDPGRFGLVASDLRAKQMEALDKSMDIGGLFLGMSMFLVAAGLMVTGLLFAFALTKRRREIGTLLALGFPRQAVNSSLLKEHISFTLIATLVGALVGVAYTWVLVQVLNGAWADVIGGVSIAFVLSWQPFVYGSVAVLVLALGVFWLRLRGLRQQSVLELLRGRLGIAGVTQASRRIAMAVAVVCLLGGVGLVLTSDIQRGVMEFFGAGSCFLIGGLALVHALMGGWVHRGGGGARSFARVALANLTRQWGRSFTVLVLLAMASFLVLAIGAHFKHADYPPGERNNGTGGFAFFAETETPIYVDLVEEGRKVGVRADKVPGMAVVPLRKLPGDEASCQNLNRAQEPTIWGVQTAGLVERTAFNLQGFLDSEQRELGWEVLDQTFEPEPWPGAGQGHGDGEEPQTIDVIPAVADLNTLMWALYLGVGDTLTYTDEHGKPFKVRFVAMVADSVFQGGVIISEQQFQNRFPSQAGYFTFLIDAPEDEAGRTAIASELTRALRRKGLHLQTAGARIDEFNRIQNMYMVVFQVLGALGLLLGSFGLVVILLRNVEERRGELATLRAIGYPRPRLLQLLGTEHLVLLLVGLGIGLAAAIIGILPTFLNPGHSAASITVVGLLAAVFVIGIGTIIIAARHALKQPLLGDLRRE